MIVDRIYDYLNGDREKVSEEALDVAARLIKSSFRRNFGRDREGGARQPSPSSKWGCQRRMFWDADASVPRERVTARSLVIFTFGDIIEQAGIVMARQALGDAVVTPDPETGKQKEVGFRIGDDVVKGHIDMTIMDPVHGELPCDWKSMSEWGFKDFQAAATDSGHKWWRENADGYIAQVRWYMMAMDAPRGYLVGVCKNTGHMAEIEIRRDRMEDERLGRILVEIHGAMRVNALPDKPAWAAKVIEKPGQNKRPDGSKGPVLEIDPRSTPGFSWACTYCPYTGKCYPGFSVVPMGKPVYRKALDS